MLRLHHSGGYNRDAALAFADWDTAVGAAAETLKVGVVDLTAALGLLPPRKVAWALIGLAPEVRTTRSPESRGA